MAAARSRDACDTRPTGVAVLVVAVAAEGCTLFVPLIAEEVDGVGILLVLTEELLRCRDGVGCVGPINW